MALECRAVTRPENSFSIAGIEINIPDSATLIRELRRRLLAGSGAAVATLNLDHVVKLRGDGSFRAAYAQHDLVTADGFPIVTSGRISGANLSRASGSDLVLPLSRLAAEVGCPVALVGSTEASLTAAAERLSSMWPGLNIAAAISPSQNFDPYGSEGRRIAESLRDSGIRLCFLALGAPKQEIFAARAKSLAPHTCFVSVGAGLDFISGHQIRAPRAIQSLRMEWAWRIAGSPRRMLPRYARCAAVLPSLLWTSLLQRTRSA